MTSPRVLMIVGQFWPMVAGAENQTRRLASELVRQGVPVEVWTRLLETSWSREEYVDGFKVRRLGIVSPFPRLRIRTLERYLFMCALFLRLLREGRSFHVFHVHQVLYPAFVTAVAAWFLRRPCLARIASTGSTSDLKLAAEGGIGVQKTLTRLLLTRIVAVNKQAEQECLYLGYRPGQIVVIPNGVLVETRFPAREMPNPTRVLFLGTLRPVKRVDLLLDSWIFAGCPGQLWIAGEGSERRYLEEKAAPACMSVEFLGHVENPTLLFRKASIFVLTSDAEGMSNALLEAMAHGCACIGTWVGGNIDALGPELSVPPHEGEYAQGSAGLLVCRGDKVGLAAALRFLCSSPARQRELGAAAFTRCRDHYSLEKVGLQYQELYQKLLS